MKLKDLFFYGKNKKSGQEMLTVKKKAFLESGMSMDNFLDSDVEKFLKRKKK